MIYNSFDEKLSTVLTTRLAPPTLILKLDFLSFSEISSQFFYEKIIVLGLPYQLYFENSANRCHLIAQND